MNPIMALVMAFFHPQLVFLLILLPISAVAQNDGYNTIGKFLTAGDDNSTPWLSSSGDFAFGFRPLMNQKDLFLLSIWFDKIPDKTIVWYPIVDKPAVKGSKVELIADRGLVLTGPQGEELWTTNTTGTLYGYMNDTGNFELQDSNYKNIWESFKESQRYIVAYTNYGKGRDNPNEAYYASQTTAGDSSNPSSPVTAPSSQIEGRCVHAPKGYSLLDPNDQYGSCKPDFIQGCEVDKLSPGEDLYTFNELINTDWPFSDYAFMKPFTEDQCKKSCMEDCMCAVAIFRLGDSCWKKKLPLSNGKVDSSLNGGKAFIKIRNR
uniref:Bulb-type lectin domain-containing protein n=1 Tax=Fagus sylvatica TaxID=28930 RepID=A0A2N9HAC7_FAGSY